MGVFSIFCNFLRTEQFEMSSGYFFAVETIVSYWFSLWVWRRVFGLGCRLQEQRPSWLCKLSLPIVYIFYITSAAVPPGNCSASKNASPGAKNPIADLSVCMCLITLEITAFCLSAFLSEISLCWQAVDRAVVLLCVYCVCTAGRTCLTLFWTSPPALNLHWFADKCAVGFWTLKFHISMI